jgi:hypothetical protein
LEPPMNMKHLLIASLFVSVCLNAHAFASSVSCVGISEVKTEARAFNMELSRTDSGVLLLKNFRGSALFGTGLNGREAGPEVMLYNDFSVSPRRINFPKDFYTVGKTSIVSLFNMNDEQLDLRVMEQSKDGNGLVGSFTIADHAMVITGSGRIQCKDNVEKK